ncbi:ligand-binding sensor domain-containing protein [Lacibacter sp. H407]|uniref:ligand-binding sensor domain-containing protein n=1 Tax=Lacibacter sp. H407 TaxID=3133423 RepID=UPI0030C063BF
MGRLLLTVAVLCWGILWSTPVCAQKKLSFKHFTVENGLSSPSVLSITQDQKGFLWVGTMDGLNRYDGKNVKIYRSFYKDNSIGSRIKINNTLAGRKNELWIGTNNGLYLYNDLTDTFIYYEHSASDKRSIISNNINSLDKDSSGDIWVSTAEGLNKIVQNDSSYSFLPVPFENDKTSGIKNIQCVFEAGNGKMIAGTNDGVVVFFKSDVNGAAVKIKRALQGIPVVSIVKDKHQNFWIGTRGNGLIKTDHEFRIVKQYNEDSKPVGLLSNIIRKLRIDTAGRIWIGTLKGLNLFYPEIEKIESYAHHPDDARSLNFNSIYDLFEDRQGNIWIGTYFGGLNYVESLTTPFIVYQNDTKGKGVSSNIISAIIEDQHNNLWIGTEAEGLNYYDRKRNIFVRSTNPKDPNSFLTSNLVKALLLDNKKNLWVGMSRGGVNVFEPSGKKWKEFGPDKGSNTINSESVSSLLQDHKNRIWIGTDDNGLNIYDGAKGKPEQFETLYPGKNLSDRGITCMFEDSMHNIWIGTGQGLNMISSNGAKFIQFFQGKQPDQLQSDFITCITQDQNGIIWIGTYMGLSAYDPDKNSFTTYTITEGLADNKIAGIVVDNRNNLWVSTNNGLNRFDRLRKQFYLYDSHDGLPGKVFNYRSFFKDKQGHIFFGTHNGLVEFDPNNVEMNRQAPGIVLTELRINGLPVKTNDSSGILKADISEINELILDYSQNVFSIEYAVMNFVKPSKNRSAYLLKGFNKDWVYTDAHHASFTNLQPGTYFLMIKGANNDGVWNEVPYQIKLKILPPPWKTWWAYTLYALFVALLAFGIIYFFVSRASLKREIRYEHMLNQQQQELHQMKLDFFTHISHEIRTPLTLVIGPVEMLMKKFSGNTMAQSMLKNIKSNADRLLTLTNDLLDFRKAEAGYTKLKIARSDIAEFTKSVFDKFIGAAEKKNIHYDYICDEKELLVYFDAHHLEIVLSNLLANAMKFAPESGKVSVAVIKTEQESVDIEIFDNGCGIPLEHQEHIFTRFYQANTGTSKSEGSGIGLAFSKKLVELHKGTLRFKSGKNMQTGNMETRFIVNLRLGKNHLKDDYPVLD